MDHSIVDLRTVPFDRLVAFYEKNGFGSANWYRQKLAPPHQSGKLLGSVCVDNSSGDILGAYLGLDQPLLCNPALKAVQSIDTLISPQARGGALMRQIGESFYRELADRGYDCVYGLPTRRSEPLRERALGWNKSRATYRYLVPLPVPLLKLAHLAFLLLLRPETSSLRKEPGLDALARAFSQQAGYICHDQRDLFFVAYRRGAFAKIGLVRSRRHRGWLDRFRTMCRLASLCGGWFLLTYATEDSETAQLFSSFSLRKWALNFSGRLLGADSKFSFGETSFEFLEFDTFGLT